MNQRDSNFEALRIIAILLVLLLHANFFALEGRILRILLKTHLIPHFEYLFKQLAYAVYLYLF